MIVNFAQDIFCFFVDHHVETTMTVDTASELCVTSHLSIEDVSNYR